MQSVHGIGADSTLHLHFSSGVLPLATEWEKASEGFRGDSSDFSENFLCRVVRVCVEDRLILVPRGEHGLSGIDLIGHSGSKIVAPGMKHDPSGLPVLHGLLNFGLIFEILLRQSEVEKCIL